MPAYAMVTVCTDVHVHCTCTSTVHVHAQYIHVLVHVHSTVHGVLIMYTVHVNVCGGEFWWALIGPPFFLFLSFHLWLVCYKHATPCAVHTAHVYAHVHVFFIQVYMYMYIYVAVPRQDSMSATGTNAVLSGHCNRFVGQMACTLYMYDLGNWPSSTV